MQVYVPDSGAQVGGDPGWAPREHQARQSPKYWAERGGETQREKQKGETPRLEEQALHDGADDCTTAHGRPMLE